jgi:hypothetical protein
LSAWFCLGVECGPAPEVLTFPDLRSCRVEAVAIMRAARDERAIAFCRLDRSDREPREVTPWTRRRRH